MFSLEELFCPIDDFCLSFEPNWKKQLIQSGSSRRLRSRQLSLSEILTILVSFHTSALQKFPGFLSRSTQESLAKRFSRA